MWIMRTGEISVLHKALNVFVLMPDYTDQNWNPSIRIADEAVLSVAVIAHNPTRELIISL